MYGSAALVVWKALLRHTAKPVTMQTLEPSHRAWSSMWVSAAVVLLVTNWHNLLTCNTLYPQPCRNQTIIVTKTTTYLVQHVGQCCLAAVQLLPIN
jgi:hypothetical protein